MKNKIALIILTILIVFSTYSQEKEYHIRTIAFYNLENLFDTINDPKKFDDDRTPDGKDRYTSKIYWDKIEKLGRVLSEIGKEKTKTSPTLIGVCEVENRAVLEDLVTSTRLKDQHYGIIHYDSRMKEESTWPYYIKSAILNPFQRKPISY